MLRIIMSAAVFLQGGLAVAQAAPCPPGSPPEIRITNSESEPRFEYSLNQAQLEKIQGNPDRDVVYDLTVNAVSTGKMRINNQMKYVTQAMPDKQICVYVSQVNVHMHIDPVIYIASELRREACKYKEYLVHEMKHVEEDRRLIGDYRDIILRNMAFALPENADYAVGPVPPSLAKDARQKLAENVAGVLQATTDSMMRERRERQRAIDSANEYLHLTRACLYDAVDSKP